LTGSGGQCEPVAGRPAGDDGEARAERSGAGDGRLVGGEEQFDERGARAERERAGCHGSEERGLDETVASMPRSATVSPTDWRSRWWSWEVVMAITLRSDEQQQKR
jgi:hypothetical protein